MRRLRMTIGEHVVHAELYDTPTADAIFSAAPFRSKLKSWGQELEFKVPVERWREADARESVRRQELIYSCERGLVSIEIGPEDGADDQVPLAQPCNVFGRAIDDVTPLRHVWSGQTILLEPLHD